MGGEALVQRRLNGNYVARLWPLGAGRSSSHRRPDNNTGYADKNMNKKLR